MDQNHSLTQSYLTSMFKLTITAGLSCNQLTPVNNVEQDIGHTEYANKILITLG